jgi:hypothetical protein
MSLQSFEEARIALERSLRIYEGVPHTGRYRSVCREYLLAASEMLELVAKQEMTAPGSAPDCARDILNSAYSYSANPDRKHLARLIASYNRLAALQLPGTDPFLSEFEVVIGGELAAHGETQQAQDFLQRGMKRRWDQLTHNFPAMTHAEKADFFTHRFPQPNRMYTIALTTGDDWEGKEKSGLTIALLYKGLVAESMRHERSVLLGSASPQVRADYDRCLELQRSFAYR